MERPSQDVGSAKAESAVAGRRTSRGPVGGGPGPPQKGSKGGPRRGGSDANAGRRHAGQGAANLHGVGGGLARAGELIQSFKRLSVGQLVDVLEDLDLVKTIRGIVQLHTSQSSSSIEIHVHDHTEPGCGTWRGWKK